MQTEWIWEAKANQAILTEKRSQKVWLKQDLLNRKHVYALLQRSRDIFFVDLARSIGIEARKDVVTCERLC